MDSAEEALEKIKLLVRKRATQIAGVATASNNMKAAGLALLLIDEVSAIVEGRTMERERAEASAYDLSALTVDLDRVHPEIDEG